MRLSRLAVSRPVSTMMAFIAIVLLGIVAYRQLPIQLFPDISFPALGVYMQRESSTEDTLDKLTKPVEEIVGQLPHLSKTMSWTGPGWTWIRVDFDYGTDIRFASLDLQERLNKFQRGLDDRRTVMMVFPFTTDFQNTYMQCSLQGPEKTDAVFEQAAERAKLLLKSISGVAKVEVGGLTVKTARVTIDPNLMAAYGLDFGQVLSRLQAVASDDTFLGTLKIPGETHYVRLNDRLKTPEELGDVVVSGNGVVRLRDVATVEKSAAVDSWVYRANGNYAVGLEVSREAGTNLIELARRTRERIAEINKDLPPGISLVVEEDLASYVEDALASIKRAALIGAGLALLVPFIFFRSFRISSVIFLSVPVCILSVFNLFLAADMSINVFSIVGLALGVGMLVDNSIVVVENCLRLFFNRRMGPKEAAEQGGDEVGRALLAATCTTVAPFVPLAFLPGEFKLLIREPALALVFPLVLSLLTALTLAPVLTHAVLRSFARKLAAARPGQEGMVGRHMKALKSNAGRLRESYRWLLKAALRHRGATIFAAVVLTAFVVIEQSGAVAQATLRQDDSDDSFSVFLNMPAGALLSEANRSVQFVEQRLRTHPDLKKFEVYFRSTTGRFNLSLKKMSERPSGKRLTQLRAGIIDFIGPVPGAEMSLFRRDEPISEGAIHLGNEGELVLKGLDFSILRPYADRLIDALRTLPSITNAVIVETKRDDEYHLLVDREKAKLFDVNAQLIGQYVRSTQASGTISRLELKDGEQTTDVTIHITGGTDDTLSATKALPIFSNVGGVVPLGELATFRTGQAPARIERTDRQSSLRLKYYFPDGVDQSEVARDVKKLIPALPNPGGVVVETGGDAQRIDQENSDLAFIGIAAVLLIYIVMAAIFESFWIPATIAATLPFLCIGVILGLSLMHLPFDPLARFGVIVLLGISVNNGIVLMDSALRYRFDHNYSRLRAVFQAADQRFRPILMTYLTTVLGLLPLTFSGGGESNARGVAVTIIGGYTSATLLTLLVLPCFYLIGDDFVSWARPYSAWAFRRVSTGAELAINGVTTIGVALFTPWKWRPRTWPAATAAGLRVLRATAPGILLAAPRAAWRGAKAVVRFVRSILADTRYALGLLRGRAIRAAAADVKTIVPAPAGALARAVHAGTADAAPLHLQNIQVIYPFGGWRALANLVPRRGYAIGHRPVAGFTALSHVSMSIEPGLFGLLGPNGAGKTTMMRCIAGLLEPTRGTVRLFGVAHREAPGQLAPLIGYLPQNHGHYEWMSLYEYLNYFATLTARTLRQARLAHGPYQRLLEPQFARLADLDHPASRDRAIRGAAEEVHLSDVLHEKVGAFSGGMKQRAGIARVLLQAPPFLIVDEPTAGLDPVERVKVRLLLSNLATSRTVLFSTHIVEDLEQSCSQVGILQRGRLLYCGAPADLRSQLEGRVWDVEIGEENPEALRESLVERGCRVLFRVAKQGGSGWRVIARSGQPHERATPSIVSLEDALLATLQART